MHYKNEREAEINKPLSFNLEYTKKIYSNPFNWTGSKHRYLKDLFDVLPNKENLKVLDPFVGGGDLISKLPKEWLITAGDSMSQIIHMHIYVQAELLNSGIISKAFKTRGMSKDNKVAYLELRKEYNKTKDPVLLYLLITNSFNNQLRFNKSGGFNIPFGKRKFNDLMVSKLDNYSESLKGRNIKFINKDFNWWDFLYFDLILVDPPYLNTTATYNESGGWSKRDDSELFNKLDCVNKLNKKFIYFNQTWSNGKQNKALSLWCQIYNVRILKDTTASCSYNKKGGKTVEIMVFN